MCTVVKRGLKSHDYRPQTKFAKVMFLHVSVSHSVHMGMCMAGGGDMHGGGHALGVCAWLGGMHGWGACVDGGHAWPGACVAREGGAASPPPPDTTRYDRSMSGRYASYWNAFLY